MALVHEQLQAASNADGELPAINGLPLNDVHLSNKTPNGHHKSHTDGIDGHKRTSGEEEYSIPMEEKLAYTPRKLRVITVGAGFSGLMMAHKLQHRYPEMDSLIDHNTFEARSQLGGTWLVNTYPGVQCDVLSAIYVSTL